MSTWGSDPRGGRDRALGTLAALASGAGLVWLAGLTLGFLGGDGLDGSGFISRATATAFGKRRRDDLRGRIVVSRKALSGTE